MAKYSVHNPTETQSTRCICVQCKTETWTRSACGTQRCTIFPFGLRWSLNLTRDPSQGLDPIVIQWFFTSPVQVPVAKRLYEFLETQPTRHNRCTLPAETHSTGYNRHDLPAETGTRPPCLPGTAPGACSHRPLEDSFPGLAQEQPWLARCLQGRLQGSAWQG